MKEIKIPIRDVIKELDLDKEFSANFTGNITFKGENTIAIEVDSCEQDDLTKLVEIYNDLAEFNKRMI